MMRFAYALGCLILSTAGAVVNGINLFMADGPLYGLINWWWFPFSLTVALMFFWANALRWEK